MMSCDLLENLYFCSIANNLNDNDRTLFKVVICLKTRTLAVSQTTPVATRAPVVALWFAWKLVHLKYRKQHILGYLNSNSGCDLLENSYFCSIANNTSLISMLSLHVVICLKTRTFAVSQTTGNKISITSSSCDLLENSYFCSIANNLVICSFSTGLVVICLKTRTFAVSQTTASFAPASVHRLWFAWKLVLLQYRKQHKYVFFLGAFGCDLLENSYFCSIANN